MKKTLTIAVLAVTVSVGAAASPNCRVTVAQQARKWSKATIDGWTAYNKTPAGVRYLATHPYKRPLSASGLALFNLACEEVALLDAHETRLLEMPDDTPTEFAQTGLQEDVVQPHGGAPPQPVDTPMKTTNSGWTGPVAYGGPGLLTDGGTPSTVPDIPGVVAVGTGLLALLWRRR